MKPALLFSAALFLCLTTARAATSVQVSVQIADVPAGTTVPTDPAKLEALKGANVFSLPKATVASGKETAFEVTEEAKTVGPATVPIGFMLKITPTITEHGSIRFVGVAVDRGLCARRETVELNTVEFATRELHFRGVVSNGGTMLVRSTRAIASADDAKAAAQKLVLLLTFKKVEPAPEPKKTPSSSSTKKKSGTSKPSGTKKKSSKS